MRAILPAEPSAVVPPTAHAAPCHVAVDCSQTSTDSGSSDRNRTQLGTVLLRSRRTRFKEMVTGRAVSPNVMLSSVREDLGTGPRRKPRSPQTPPGALNARLLGRQPLPRVLPEKAILDARRRF